MIRGAALIALLFLTPLAAADCITPQWVEQRFAIGTLHASHVAAADFDRDGTQDVAALAGTSSSAPLTRVVVLLRRGSGYAAHQVVLTSDRLLANVVAADVNKDARTDLVVVDSQRKTLTTLPGKGDGTFNAAVVTPLANVPALFAVADFTNDTRLDVVVYEKATETLQIYSGDATGKFTKVFNNSPATDNAASMIAADFNNDGDMDAALGEANSGELMVFFGGGDGVFAFAAGFGTESWPIGLATGDLDRDGNIDLAAASTTHGSVTVHYNAGSGLLLDAESYRTTGANPTAVAIADFTGDTRLDLAAATRNEKIFSFTNKGDGSFRAGVTGACAGCELQSLVAVDADKDNRVDLVTADGAVIVMANHCGGTNVTLTSSQPTIRVDQSAILDFAVAPIVSGMPAPTGTITLREGNSVLGTRSVSASPIVIGNLTAGTPNLTVHYSGDAEYEPNTSAVFALFVAPIPTNTSIQQSAVQTVYGENFTIAARAVAGESTPTGGTMKIFFGDQLVGTTNGPLATLTIGAELPVGAIVIGATYSGDERHAASSATTSLHTIVKATPLVSVVHPATVEGSPAIFTITVTPPFFGKPTGALRVFSGTTLLGQIPVDPISGTRVFSASLPLGTHQIRVVYDGDANFASAETTFTHEVIKRGPKRRSARH